MDKIDQKFHLLREAIFKEDTPGLHIYCKDMINIFSTLIYVVHLII